MRQTFTGVASFWGLATCCGVRDRKNGPSIQAPDGLPCRLLSNEDLMRSLLNGGKAGFSLEEGKPQSSQRTEQGSTVGADIRLSAGGHLPSRAI